MLNSKSDKSNKDEFDSKKIYKIGNKKFILYHKKYPNILNGNSFTVLNIKIYMPKGFLIQMKKKIINLFASFTNLILDLI